MAGPLLRAATLADAVADVYLRSRKYEWRP